LKGTKLMVVEQGLDNGGVSHHDDHGNGGVGQRFGEATPPQDR
jgi:hypothetical protein